MLARILSDSVLSDSILATLDGDERTASEIAVELELPLNRVEEVLSDLVDNRLVRASSFGRAYALFCPIIEDNRHDSR